MSFGIDVVPAADDQFLLAPCEPEVAVGVLPAEVAGVEPRLALALDPDPLVVRRIEIAGEDVGPADGDDADLVGRRVANISVVAVEDQRAHVLIGKPEADRTDPRRGVERGQARGAGALGQAVAFENADAGFALELMEQLHRHRRRAADRRFQALDVPPGDRRLQQRRIDGRNAREHGDAKMLDQRPEVRDHALAAIALRRRHHDIRALRPRRETGHQLAVHVKERQAAEDRLAGAEAILVEARSSPRRRTPRRNGCAGRSSASRSCRRCRSRRRCRRASAARNRARRRAPSPVRGENRAREP